MDKKIEEMTDHELLQDICAKERKEAKMARVAAIANWCILGVVVIALIVWTPKVFNTLNKVNALIDQTAAEMEQVSKLTENAEKSMEEIDVMVKNINDLVVTNTDQLTNAVENLNSIDFEGLNSSIGDLESIISPLADFMGKFK